MDQSAGAAATIVTASPNSISPLPLSLCSDTNWVLIHWTRGLVLQPPLLMPPLTAYPNSTFSLLWHYLSIDALDERAEAEATIVMVSPNSISPLPLSLRFDTSWVLMHWTKGLMLQPPLLPPPQAAYPHFPSLFAVTLPKGFCTGREG